MNTLTRQVGSIAGSAKCWAGTVHNYEAVDGVGRETMIKDCCDANAFEYVIYGKEVCPTTQRKHLQIMIVCHGKMSLNVIKNTLGFRDIHLSQQYKGVKYSQTSDYCKKDGDFYVHGVCPPDKAQGKRNDIAFAIEWLRAHPGATNLEIAQSEIAVVYFKYQRATENFRDLLSPPVETIDVEGTDLKPWQAVVETYSQVNEINEATKRHVLFIVDKIGGAGKTTVLRYIATKYASTTQIITPMSAKDTSFLVDAGKTTFLFNVPRGGGEWLSQNVCESLKDGALGTGKYKSCNKLWDYRTPRKVIVFLNEEPNRTMTADRYDVRYVNKGHDNFLTNGEEREIVFTDIEALREAPIA